MVIVDRTDDKTSYGTCCCIIRVPIAAIFRRGSGAGAAAWGREGHCVEEVASGMRIGRRLSQIWIGDCLGVLLVNPWSRVTWIRVRRGIAAFSYPIGWGAWIFGNTCTGIHVRTAGASPARGWESIVGVVITESVTKWGWVAGSIWSCIGLTANRTRSRSTIRQVRALTSAQDGAAFYHGTYCSASSFERSIGASWSGRRVIKSPW